MNAPSLPPKLPTPNRKRWQPIRSGLINLFHYADEQFWYEDGRMLLRGNNGTGKSRVLALQLPFLLDAELSPTRMEPDRSPSKRPEWNLLLGGKHRDRLGYTWIEFGRLDEDGFPHYFTLGCGLHAVEHRGSADAWFFTLDGRIGEDLNLVVDSVPLSKSRLSETLTALAGDRGQVYARQGDYRRAVDERLFRLSNRYRSLIDLLIQLRVPQLSRDFDEQRMNAQLSSALPPLPADVLAQVADAMKDLDEQRERLDELRRSGSGAREFSDHYRRYLQIALRRRVEELSSEHNRYDRAQRSINDITRKLNEAVTAYETTLADQMNRETDRRKIRSTLDALRSRPEMQDALRLDEMRQSCERLSIAANKAGSERDRAAERLTETTKRLKSETDELKYANRRTSARIETLSQINTPGSLHDRFMQLAPTLIQHESVSKPLAEIDKELSTCRNGLVTLEKAEVEIRQARGLVEHEIKTQGLFENQVEDAIGALGLRQQQVRSATQSLKQALIQWSEDSRESIPHSDLTEAWTTDSDDPNQGDEFNPSELAWPTIKIAIDGAIASLSSRRHQLNTQTAALQTELDEWKLQRTRLQQGEHQPPPTPHTRDANARDSREGAPLYQLCDFADSVPESERAAWEAALEASGLLDAFVSIDGNLTSDQLDDVTLIAVAEIENPALRLSSVLQPAATLPTGMNSDVVVGLLSGIGCCRDSAAAWVDQEGAWQIGPKTGHWSKPTAEHIGAAAREDRRLRQIESLTRQIDTSQTELESFESEIERLDQERGKIESHANAFPSDRELVAAFATLAATRSTLIECETRLADQLSKVGQVRSDLSDRISRRDRDANDLGMTAWITDLDSLRANLQSFSGDLESLRRDLQDIARHTATHDRCRADYEASFELDRQRAAERQNADDERAAKQAEFDTLNQNVGADVREIQDQIVAAEQQELSIEGRLKELQAALNELSNHKGELQGSLNTSQEVLQRHEADRAMAISRVSQLADSGLAQQAVSDDVEFPDPPWSPTRAAQIAKQIRTQLRETPLSDEAWNEAQNTIQVEFRALENALLPTGNTPQSQTQDDLIMVTVPMGGVVCSPAMLATQLADQVRHNETMITERERELFEERLIGDIAQSLHQNIREAHTLCQGMNDEVESRPMSTGMRLRFRWKPIQDGSDDIKTACNALLRKPSAMSASDRSALGGFLQRQIQEARNRDDAGTWQQHLADALDYRTWFSFDIERETDGRWQRLTKRTHGTGSGGERAVALIIPMLAALAAYYQSADDVAPRIILMDEAFVGIDNEMRAKFMDLLVQFDLDFVMTSEREWGCYPTMPALAIYHLATRRGVDAILPTRWVWNGNGKRMDDVHEQMRQAALFSEDSLFDAEAGP